MTELLLAPLAVALLLLVVRYVGCALDRIGTGPGDPIPPAPPDYGAAILAEPDLVAYWRLGEPAGTAAGDPAADAEGGHPGTYRTADLSADVALRSPETAHPPLLQAGQAGLLGAAPALTCVRVNGGYVRVPFHADLNPPKTPGFSLEAWVHAEWSAGETSVFRCVLASRTDGGVGDRHGFMLYAGPRLDPMTFTVVDPAMRWQAWVGDGTTWRMLPGPLVQVGITTYLLVTYDGASETLALDAVAPDVVDLDTYPGPWTLPATSYSPSPGPAPLYIGMGAPERPVPSPGPLYPFLGRIQEVALYRAPLPGASFTTHLRGGVGI